MPATRIDPERARQELESGGLLVCAYNEAEKCAKYSLAGAISMDELRSREASLSKKQPLIFYCA